jgi:hypothetical protein
MAIPSTTALRWVSAAAGGATVAALVTTALAALVERAANAPPTGALADPAPGPGAACPDSFALAGAQPVRLATRVGFHALPGGGFTPIAGARLFELYTGLESGPRQEERWVAVSDAEGGLEFVWERRFWDGYTCGSLTSAWKQSSQLYVLRAPGCEERTIVVSSGWAPPRLVLECRERRASAGRWL